MSRGRVTITVHCPHCGQAAFALWVAETEKQTMFCKCDTFLELVRIGNGYLVNVNFSKTQTPPLRLVESKD